MTLHRHLQPSKQLAVGRDVTLWQKLPTSWWWCQAQVRKIARMSQSPFPALATQSNKLAKQEKHWVLKVTSTRQSLLGFFTLHLLERRRKNKKEKQLQMCCTGSVKSKLQLDSWLWPCINSNRWSLSSWGHLVMWKRTRHPLKTCWERTGRKKTLWILGYPKTSKVTQPCSSSYNVVRITYKKYWMGSFCAFLSQGKSTRWMRTHRWAALIQSMTWAPFRGTSASWRTPLPWRKWCSPPSQHPGWRRRSSAWDLPTRPCRPSPPKSERPTTALPSASERGAGLLTHPLPKVRNVLHARRHQSTLAVVQLISR